MELKERIRKIFEILSADNPHPKGELKFNNSFELLCAVMLSAQTTDKAVNQVTPILFAKAPDAQSMLKLTNEEIENIIKKIGLYRNKAKNLKALCESLVNDFNGEIPSTEEELIKLPGVGKKTARVVLNIAFNKPCIAVDTHIFRVVKRLDISRAKTPDLMSDALVKIIPKEYIHDAHHWFILHGRYVCSAKNPKCETCLIGQYCRKINV